MNSSPLSQRSRLALLSGVSIVALQGLAGCMTTEPVVQQSYATPVTVPVAPVPGTAEVAQYQPVPVAGGTATTLAIGEEDGGTYTPYDPGTVTTLAVGEEDGSGPFPVEPDGGIGDGAGPPSFATTLALGEEDGQGSYAPVDPGTATTLAIGEEDGSGPFPVEPDGGIGDGAGPPPFATTLALGEEDGSVYQPPTTGTVTTLALGEEESGGYGSSF
jgi:hypothetical protein